MLINADSIAALNKGYRVLFDQAYQAGQPMWPQMALRTTSSNADETYNFLGSIPGMRELVDSVQIRNLAAHGFTILNKEWEDTIEIKRKDIERDSYGLYNPLFQAMGRVAAEHADELVANLLLNGFTQNCYTGTTFFSTTHMPQANKTGFSNRGTKKISAANYATARENIKSRLNAEGRPMNLGSGLTLIVSPAYETTARQILEADLIINAGGTAAGTNVDKGTAKLIVWPRLAADPDKWFLVDLGQVMKPFIFQEEKPVSLTSATAPNSVDMLLNHRFIYQAYGRYNAGYGLPELAYGSTGADAA
ncbi:head protein [Verrucomicrobia bacterium LW23]|nr:head protein [Verrucomicrobia bacterium LW23]PTY04413.1 head protein [Verrucomicrobia bacterium LW23]